jgi:ribosomal protein S18 acetylase RimI-like enzyme
MEVREAAVADAEELALVHVLTWRHAYRGIVPGDVLDGLSVDQQNKVWQKILTDERPDDQSWLAESAGSVVGFVWAGRSRDQDATEHTGEVFSMYVLPTHQRGGAGSALLQVASKWLFERFPSARLWVLEDNAAGRRFYEKWGWRTDTTAREIAIGSKMLREVRYKMERGPSAV